MVTYSTHLPAKTNATLAIVTKSLTINDIKLKNLF